MDSNTFINLLKSGKISFSCYKNTIEQANAFNIFFKKYNLISDESLFSFCSPIEEAIYTVNKDSGVINFSSNYTVFKQYKDDNSLLSADEVYKIILESNYELYEAY